MFVFALAAAVLALAVGGSFYSRFLARQWGIEADRRTPAVELNDGRDYVPTPTPVVFAHHFASIAGAGPIVGPVIALAFGWAPALLWIVIGGLAIGGVHDFLATFMTLREGGHSIATVTRRMLGKGPFIALVLFLIVTLALVCATFLNLSATALTSTAPHARLGLAADQTLFRIVGEGEARRVVIGGIASTSVIVITLVAPLIGWLYIRRRVPVRICSLLALAICGASITVGVFHPIALSEGPVLGALTGPDIWKLILGAYVLMAAGVPVWIFLQSRDFINVHILYAGLAALVVSLAAVALRGAPVPPADAIPAWDAATGGRALGSFWPALFITIACGAVSGFHSLCAGGTTCKQLTAETAARRTGYGAMILESFLAACVVGVMVMGLRRAAYHADVHPALLGLPNRANPILGFAMAVGHAAHAGLGLPIAAGALGGMILLEGFLVTTLDTAVRLMRYLLEEVWHALLGAPAPDPASPATSGARGIPAGLAPTPPEPRRSAPPGRLARVLQHYWVNSGIAVALMLWFAFSSGILSLWALFATANQLLAAFVLLLGALWLLRRGRRAAAAVIPALFMLVTTMAGLVDLLLRFRPRASPDGAPMGNPTLFAAVLALLGLAVYLVAAGIRGRFQPEGNPDGHRPTRP